MALLLAGLWAAVACTMLQPEAGVMAVPATQPPRKFLGNICQPKRTSGQAAGRIFKGFDAPKKRFAYMAFLTNYDAQSNCGGALIHSQWVLTSARCIYNSTRVSVTLGATNITSREETWRQCQHADRILTVPRFRPKRPGNDIGLLHLPEPADIGVYIQTIPVATRAESEVKVVDGVIHGVEDAVVAGWGHHGPNATEPADLKYVYVKTINPNVCKLEYPDGFDDTNECMRGVIGSACSGDEGVPVEYNNTVHAVLSHGVRPCGQDLPIVATNVGSFVHWIRQTINGEGVSTTQLPAG